MNFWSNWQKINNILSTFENLFFRNFAHVQPFVILPFWPFGLTYIEFFLNFFSSYFHKINRVIIKVRKASKAWVDQRLMLSPSSTNLSVSQWVFVWPFPGSLLGTDFVPRSIILRLIIYCHFGVFFALLFFGKLVVDMQALPRIYFHIFRLVLLLSHAPGNPSFRGGREPAGFRTFSGIENHGPVNTC